MAPEFSRNLYMGHGPSSMDGSRIVQKSVDVAWAKLYGWLQDCAEGCRWGHGPGSMDGSRIVQKVVDGGMGQALWVAPGLSRDL